MARQIVAEKANRCRKISECIINGRRQNKPEDTLAQIERQNQCGKLTLAPSESSAAFEHGAREQPRRRRLHRVILIVTSTELFETLPQQKLL